MLPLLKTLSSLQVDFPRAVVSRIHTTDLLERLYREVRRTQRDIGLFPSEPGDEILCSLRATRETDKQRAAAHIHRHEEFAKKIIHYRPTKCYLTPESLSSMVLNI